MIKCTNERSDSSSSSGRIVAPHHQVRCWKRKTRLARARVLRRQMLARKHECREFLFVDHKTASDRCKCRVIYHYFTLACIFEGDNVRDSRQRVKDATFLLANKPFSLFKLNVRKKGYNLASSASLFV